MIDFREEQALTLLASLDIGEMEHLDNPQFSFIDSAVLYHLVKTRKPRRIVEVGSGYSTGIILQAHQGQLVSIDPEPRTEIASEHIAARVEHVGLEVFNECDLLFVDGSHYVKQGGDAPHIFFKVLPRLKGGALVHFHDIFLPDDYPPGWEPRQYGEMYLLRAFLEHNPDYRVVWPGYLMATRHKEKMIAKLGTASSVGSLWVEKC